MCSFNSEKYIRESLDSMLGQTLQDIEVLLVDDGSTDGTLSYLRSVQDSRLKLIALERNQGLIHARMTGFRAAQSELIAIMDADDIAHPQRLQKQYEVLHGRQADVCGSFHVSLNESDGRRKLKPSFVDSNDLRALLTIYSPLCNPSVSFRRSILDHIAYNPAYQHAEDYGFWCDISLADFSFHNVPQALLTYRVHGGQISQVKLDAARAAFQRAQAHYLTHLLGWDGVPHALPFLQRIRVASRFLKRLSSRLGPLSFAACYQLYAEFQHRRNGLLTIFTRLERAMVSLYAATVWK